MNRLDWLGVAIAAAAVGHLGVRAAGRLCRRGRRFLTDCIAGWMDELDDLAPGRLAHGQGAGDGAAD